MAYQSCMGHKEAKVTHAYRKTLQAICWGAAKQTDHRETYVEKDGGPIECFVVFKNII
jgi:hypothetical protein